MGELTVVLQDERTVRAQTPDGSAAFTRLDLDDLRVRVIRLFDDWLRRKKVTEPRELQLFGEVLYNAILNGEVGGLFEQLLTAIGAPERLRVQLQFDAPAGRLARLPWEFLYRPGSQTSRGFFLGTERRLVLSRYLPLREGLLTTLQPDAGPLRILVAVASPRDQERIVVDPVVEAISRLAAGVGATVTVLAEATADTLLDALEAATPPHVLHFMGHGEFDEQAQRGQVALVGPGGTANWLPDQVFAELVTQADPPPRMVVLHACEGGTADFASDDTGLAPELVRLGVPAVIAMQYVVTNLLAAAFSQTLYDELVKGVPLDHAVQRSRWRLANVGDRRLGLRDFGAPVLYLRSRNALVIPQTTAPAGPPAGR
jgi:CHAT domain